MFKKTVFLVLFFHFCFFNSVPHVQKISFFFWGVYFFDVRHVQKIMSFFCPHFNLFFLCFAERNVLVSKDAREHVFLRFLG